MVCGIKFLISQCVKFNFPEASVTTQFMYAYAKAVNKGYVDKKV